MSAPVACVVLPEKETVLLDCDDDEIQWCKNEAQKRNPDGTCFAAIVMGLSHYRAALTSVAEALPSNCALINWIHRKEHNKDVLKKEIRFETNTVSQQKS